MSSSFQSRLRVVWFSGALLLLLAFTLLACAPKTAPSVSAPRVAPTQAAAQVIPTATPVPSQPTPTAPLTADIGAAKGLNEAVLMNGQYQLPDVGAVQLENGRYEKKYGSGATQVNRVTLGLSAIGDLNGNGVRDAVVLLAFNSGGSGTFIYLAPVLAQDDTARQGTPQLLGDRVKVNNLAIQDGKVVVELVSAGPNDPLCCPSQRSTLTYQLEGPALKLLSEVKSTTVPRLTPRPHPRPPPQPQPN